MSWHTPQIRYRDTTLLKYGPRVTLLEAENMRRVQGIVSCPAIIDCFEDEGVVYIEMERIRGQELGKIWRDLSPSDRTAVAKNVCAELDKLHAIEGEMVPFNDPFFGRFDANNESQMNKEALLKAWGPNFRDVKLPTDTKICLSHGDLHTGNVLVRDDLSVCLIDWDCLTYLPEYWDVMKLGLVSRHDNILNYIDTKAWDSVLKFYYNLSECDLAPFIGE